MIPLGIIRVCVPDKQSSQHHENMKVAYITYLAIVHARINFLSNRHQCSSLYQPYPRNGKEDIFKAINCAFFSSLLRIT